MSGTQVLLAEYADAGSEQAFRELVTAYVDFVYSTALRIVGGDRALAEDVTQAVFTDLARKALLLPKDVRLGGWLHRHTCFVARKTLRRERRRIAREKQAVELHSVEDYTDANLAQLALVLDEAINDLGKEDRNAIGLRFFEELDFRSIGEALGSSEDAARMRVSRAVDKIRALLRRRGFVLSAAGISVLLSGRLATAAPAGLATRIVYVELARPAKAAGVIGLLKEAFFTRLNVGIASAAVILALFLLFISARPTRAKELPDPNGKKFTPAEFAELAMGETEEQNGVGAEVVAIKSTPAPTPGIAPVSPAAKVVPSVSVKSVMVNRPGAVPVQTPIQPATTPPAPSENGTVAGQSMASAQVSQTGTWRQGPGRYAPPPYVAPRPQMPGVAATNGISASFVKKSPEVNSESQPWSQMRTMSSMEPPAISPNPPSIQGGNASQRNMPLSRSTDPRRQR